MPKSKRSNLNFRQTAREFRSAAVSRVSGRIQRLYPYTKYHLGRFWTMVSKPGKMTSGFTKRKKI